MAEYYKNQYGNSRNRNKKSHSSLWAIPADIIMYVISAIAAAGIITVFVGRFVPPERMWYFALPALIAPIIYIAALASTLYWIIRWKWAAVITMLVFVVLGLFHVSLYYKLDITREYGQPVYERGNIAVVSYNVRMFRNDAWADVTGSTISSVGSLKPDIVCFQEFPTAADARRRIDTLMRGYTPCRIHAGTDNYVECYTKYRILNTSPVFGMQGTASGMYADLQIGTDTVRVINVHLQTTSVSPDDKQYISERRFIADATRELKMRGIARRLKDNNVLRARQAEIIRTAVAKSPYPVILCGDFNDVPVSYSYRIASQGLDDTFSSGGQGYAHTFRGFHNMLRIDYILVSPQFETLSYEVPAIAASDHYPVFARVKLTQNR